MNAKSKTIILTAIAAVFASMPSWGSDVLNSSNEETQRVIVEEQRTVTVTKLLSDSTVVEASFTDMEEAQRFAADDKQITIPHATSKKRKMSNVMVGLELGTGLDLSGNDLSTFNTDILVGYRHKFIQLLGVGAGVHKSLGTRDNFIPIYVVFRTGFMTRPTLMFMHMSAGYGFNTIASSKMFGDITASLGAGVNLVRKPRFQSNIILSIGFRHFSQRHQEMIQIYKQNVGYASISFGVSM